MENILEIFNLDNSEVNLDLNSKKESDLYNPKPEGKETYSAIIRFLPIPVMVNGDLTGVEKEPFYMKKRYYLRDANGVGFYFDSPTTIGERCPISSAYFRLKNSQNVLDKKKAEELKLNTHFWSLILIVDDKKNPELNGKIKIFRYTSDIHEKIKNQWEKRQVKVWDLFKGKNFDLSITNKKVTFDNGTSREFQDFIASEFLDVTPLKFNGTTFDRSDANVTNLIKELYKASPDMSGIKYRAWNVEERANLDKILDRYNSREDFSDAKVTTAETTYTKSYSEDALDETDELMKSLDL